MRTHAATALRRFAPVTLLLAMVTPAAAGPPALTAAKAVKAPVIDGVVGPDEWAGAAAARDFVQYEPRRGEPSTYATEALVLYDESALYVAFRSPDPEPPVAHLTQRDADLFSDDSVIVLLDSFFDRQTAYYFATNPLGAQADGRVADDGRTLDLNWDGLWRAAARRVESGWSAEFAIPLNALKYVAGTGRTWGLNLRRVRRRSLEVSFWAGPLDARLRVSQAGRLSGLTVPPPQRRHQAIPYALARVQEREPPAWQGGLDVRYGLTPTTAVYGTVNPDFATVEADQEQINLKRFELALREKRPFFLEGQELFAQRIRTFYSRRVADIAAGGKVLGKQRPWTFAFLGAGSDQPQGGGPVTYSVGRVQRDLGRSNVAATFASRRLDGVDEGSGSLDATLFFTRTFGLTAQLARGFGRFHTDTWAYFVRPSYDSPTSHFHVRYTHLGDRFADTANAIGFIRDDDRREVDSAFSRTIWVKSGAFERIDYSSNYNGYWGQDRRLRGWQVDEVVDVELRNRWGVRATWTEDLQRFEKDFRNRQIGIEAGYNTRAYQSVHGGLQVGRTFDSDYRLWLLTARRKLTDALSAEYELQRLTLDPDPDRDGTWIHVFRANHAFASDLFLRLFFQTHSAIDRRHAEAVFVYRYRPPFGTLQLVYQRAVVKAHAGTVQVASASGEGTTVRVELATLPAAAVEPAVQGSRALAASRGKR